MRISLGTAQFGLDYGITNDRGQVSETDVADILKVATQLDVKHLDTAAAYGVAETVLADQSQNLDCFSVTSKIPSLAHLNGQDASSALQTHIRASCERLGPALKTILLHDITDLLRPEGLVLWQTLEREAADLGIAHLGLSVYDSTDIKAALNIITPDVVQLPLSVFDQRLLHDGSLDVLQKRGCSIEARSIFLQGLVLAKPSAIPYHLRGLAPAAIALEKEAATSGATALEIALGFLRLTGCIDRAVVGVTSKEDLQAICKAKKTPLPSVSYPNFRVCETSLVDPRCWSQLMEEKRAS